MILLSKTCFSVESAMDGHPVCDVAVRCPLKQAPYAVNTGDWLPASAHLIPAGAPADKIFYLLLNRIRDVTHDKSWYGSRHKA